MSHPEGHALIISTMGSDKTRCFDLLIFGRFYETLRLLANHNPQHVYDNERESNKMDAAVNRDL